MGKFYKMHKAPMNILHVLLYRYFSRGNIFVKVVILAISWKKFRGFGRAHAVRDAVCAFSCANISWSASRPRKPRKYYPSKNTRYTVLRDLVITGAYSRKKRPYRRLHTQYQQQRLYI